MSARRNSKIKTEGHIAHDIMVEDKVEEQVLRQKEKDILFNGTWRETKSKVTYS